MACLLVLAPLLSLSPAGREHGRTIPLSDILRLKCDGTVAKRNGHCVGPRSRTKLCNRPLHVPLNSSVREGQNFADLNDRFSCGYPSKYLTFAIAEFDILLGRAIERLDGSERVKCHQMQCWFVTVQYLKLIAAHPDIADVPG